MLVIALSQRYIDTHDVSGVSSTLQAIVCHDTDRGQNNRKVNQA
jgi:hypothetical protein